jgi:hypothetical protein
LSPSWCYPEIAASISEIKGMDTQTKHQDIHVSPSWCYPEIAASISEIKEMDTQTIHQVLFSYSQFDILENSTEKTAIETSIQKETQFISQHAYNICLQCFYL